MPVVDPKTRVLYYEPSSGYGGSPRSLRDILLKLDLSRYEPVVAVIDDGPAIKEIAALGFKVVPVYDKKQRKGPVFTSGLMSGYGQSLLYLARHVLPLSLRLSRLIRQCGIDIVHVNTIIRTGLEAIVAGWMTGRPVICHLRSTCRWTRLEQLAARLVTKCICLTDDAMQQYREYVPAEKLIRLYNGVDLQGSQYSRSFADVRSELGLAKEMKVVGIVGRITPGKGHETFLEAASLVHRAIPLARFLVVGDVQTDGEAELKTCLKKMVQDLGLGETVIFTGWRADVLDVIAGMDLLVQASTTFPEGFSRTCVEAMALGVPLVVSRIPGAAEIVADGATGFVVTPGNGQEMAGAVVKLLGDPGLHQRFAAQGRARVRELFDLQNIVSEIEQLYGRVLASSRSRGGAVSRGREDHGRC